MRNIKLTFNIIIILLFSQSSFSQNIGIPFIQNYTVEDYKGSSQSWSFIQDNNRILFVGNGDGLLEYDGTNWRIIKMPNNSQVRSLTISKEGRIYVGAKGEVGYLDIDSVGKYKYISLLNKIPREHRNFTYIWSINEVNGTLFFNTRNSLYYLSKSNPDSFKIITIEKQVYSCFLVNNTLYVNEQTKGLKKFEKDSLVLIPRGELFSKRLITDMIPEDNDKITIVTRYNGIYLFNTKFADTDSLFIHLDTEIQDIIKEKEIKHTIKSSEGKYFFATLYGGIIVTDKDFNILYIIDKEKGLLNNQVLSLYEDTYNNIWAATSNGISYIISSASVTKYGESSGLEGQVYSVAIHNNKLYLSCSDGTYFQQKNREFKKIESIKDQSWFLKIKNDTLYCGNRYGYKTILDTISKSGNFTDNIWSAVNYPGTDMQLVGTYLNSLVLMKKQGDVFNLVNKISGYDESARFFEIDKNGYIWITTQAKGVRRLKLNKELDSVIENKVYDVKKGMPENSMNYVFKITDDRGEAQIIFATQKAIYRYDSKTDSIVPYKKFNNIVGENQVDLFVEDENKNIWFQADTGNGYHKGVLLKQKDGSYKLFDKFYYKFHKVYAEGIRVIEDNIFFCTAEGVYINQNFNPEKKEISYPAIIREILLSDSVIFYGNKEETSEISRIFKYKNNSLIFKFSAPFFEDSKETQYTWFLEGFDEKWHDFTANTEKEYTNLREGDYTFKVKAINVYKQESSVDEFRFTILPPWYRTFYAYISYFILGNLFIWFVVKLNTRRLKKEKEKLEGIVKERTVEISQQNEEIQTQADNLRETNTKLEERNEEINQQKEEIQAIVDNLREANEKISGVNKELKNANVEIRQKNKHITDSIQYAKRIQKAVFLQQEQINDYFPDNFILFKPKEIVSGDFHKFERIGDYYIFAAVDCTGHGVPGAFMSMLAYAFISEIIVREDITQTNEVLELLRNKIKKALQQNEEIFTQKDGLDIAFCALNSKTSELQYSGAHNPLYIIADSNNLEKRKENFKLNKKIHIHRFSPEYKVNETDITNNSLIEIKGDKMPVGFTLKERKFKMQKIQLHKGDRVYLFTDGYIDQFGGKYGRKFLYHNFRDLLLEISDKPMKIQKKILLETFYSWKGDNSQIDDMLVMGLKI